MSEHLRLVSDNTKGAVLPGPGFKAGASPTHDYVQSFVFLENNGVMIIMHNGAEVSALAAVDAMAAVAAHLYRRSLAAKAAAASTEPRPRAEICDEIFGDGA